MPNSILLMLINGINSTKQQLVVGWDKVKLWTPGALEKLIESGILVQADRAKSLECNGCARRCFAEIATYKDKSLTRTFIVCGDPEMQSQMGRIEVPLVRLQQWQCGTQQFVIVISHLLSLECKVDIPLGQGNIRIGMLKGTKGRRWISLNTNPLSLEINGYALPLEEILFFENGRLVIDKSRIVDQLNKTPRSTGKLYVPSTNKREESKRKTLSMRQNWNDAYLRLQKDNPNKSAVWCSIQIAKTPISQGKDAKTILRYMK